MAFAGARVGNSPVCLPERPHTRHGRVIILPTILLDLADYRRAPMRPARGHDAINLMRRVRLLSSKGML